MVSADEARRELARRELERRRAKGSQPVQESPSWGNTAVDVLKSAGAGLARGTAGLAGLPGTLGDLVDQGGEFLMRQAGLPTRSEAMAVQGLDAGNPLSAQSLQDAMSVLSGGATDYRGQTTAGQYAGTLGEFAPGGLALRGPMTLGKAAIYGTALPAVASETAGQLTEGSDFEPIARVAGALAGGYAGNRLGAPSREALPTARDIKSSAGYGDDFTDVLRGAQTTDNAYAKIIGDLWDDVKQAGTSYEVQQNFGRTMQNEMRLVQQEGASLHSLERLRRALNSAGGGALDTPNKAIASRLIDKLDDAVENLSAAEIAQSGATGKPVLESLKEAREIYRTGKKAEIIEEAMRKAQTQASGVENGLRIQFRRLLDSKDIRKNFSQTEQDYISKVANGDFTTNALRWVGSFGVPMDQGRSAFGSFMGGGAGAAIGSLFGGPAGAAVGSVAVPAMGTAAKYGAVNRTNDAANLVEALVKGGPQGQQAITAQQAANQAARNEAIVRSLLQSQQAYSR